MRRPVWLLALCVSALAAAPLAAQDIPPIGIIDFYGARTVPESTLRRALGIREGDSVPSSSAAPRSRLRAIPGVANARLNLVCCSDDGQAMLFVGIAERAARRLTFSSAPTGNVRLPTEILQLGRAYDDTLMSAVRQGRAVEKDSAGHAFFEYPAANAIQHRFLALARTRLSLLRDVLHNSSSAEDRALAAQLLGYAPRVTDVVPDLEVAMRDPDDNVRNNAMRALAVIALYARESSSARIRVSAAPFADMLNSLVWTDLNKASLALDRLTASRDPVLLALLRERSLAALVDIARWKSPGHASPAWMILGRIEGLPEQTLQQAWGRGDRAVVLDSATRMLAHVQSK